MNPNNQSTRQIHCQQCSAVLRIGQETRFVTCEFCSATNYVDQSHVVFHYAVQPTIEVENALSILRRWMGSNLTVKNLDRKAKIGQTRFEYYPMWMVRTRQSDENRVIWKPGSITVSQELKHLSIPAGNLEPFKPNVDKKAIPPTIKFDLLRKRLQENHQIKAEDIRDAALVHVPIIKCDYSFKGKTYTAIVEAATGKVYADIYPSKWEVPYITLGMVAFLVYLFIALIPAIWFEANRGQDMAIGMGIYCLAALIAALPIYLAAYFILKKV